MEQFPESFEHLERHAFHAAERAWTGLSAFLLAQSVLALAWAAIYAANEASPAKSVILIGLSIAGVITGVQWSMLGTRMWQFHLLYMNQLKDLTPEAQKDVMWGNIDKQIEKLWGKDLPLHWITKWSANHYIHLTAPLILSTVHAVMLGVILWRVHDLGPYVTVGLGVAYAMVVAVVWSVCSSAIVKVR